MLELHTGDVRDVAERLAAEAAARLGRNATLIDIVPAYTDMQRRRLLGADAMPLIEEKP